jgi:hypothetical protein
VSQNGKDLCKHLSAAHPLLLGLTKSLKLRNISATTSNKPHINATTLNKPQISATTLNYALNACHNT